MTTTAGITLTDLERLIHDLRGQISKQDHQDNILNRMRIVALNDMERRIQDIRHLTARQKLKLAFIGPVGVGKTTVICDLLGLRVRHSKDGETTFRKVLTTASGRTTACEVQLLIRDEVRIDVDYHDEAELLTMLEGFCWYHWQEAEKPVDEIFDQPANETQKVIRNLVGLKKEAATKLAQQYEEFGSFFEDVVNRYRAEDRTQTELVHNGLQEDALKWTAEHFKKLNLGTLPGFSLPRSIRISLPRLLLHIPPGFNVDCIVDTKGLEATGHAREDIDRYVRSGEYLCVFVDRFTNAPDSVIPTLDLLLRKEAVDTEQRCVLIVNTKHGEATASLDDDGEYTSEADGHAIKASQIKTAFAAARIHRFLDENVYFYDPHRHFDSEREELTLKRGRTYEDVRTNAAHLWERLGDALLRQDAYFRAETEQLKKRLHSLEVEGVLQPGDQAALKMAHTSIQRIGESFTPTQSSLRNYIRALGGYHVSTFRAINNRYGHYNGNDVYYEAGAVSERFFRGLAQQAKDGIEEVLQDLRANVSSQQLKECLEQYRLKLNADYQQTVSSVRGSTQNLVEEEIHPQRAPGALETFWGPVTRRWGGGPGYRDEVQSMYAKALDKQNRDEPSAYRALWKDRVVRPLLDNLYI
jgi:hypothetical protein